MGQLKVFFHDNCFDGTSSASLFADFFRQRVDGDAAVTFEGVQHRQGNPFEGREFCPGDNACVDFRYTDHPGLTWWFDHHASAFVPEGLRAHFEADTGGQKFYDPAAPSNTRFMAETLQARFEYRPGGHYADLIHWANIIDSAAFSSAEMAVELAEPALQLMTWLENNPDPALTDRYIRELGTRPLADIAQNDWIREPLAPLLAGHRQNIDLIGERAEQADGVVYFDLIDDDVGVYNKFIPYMLFPAARYTVGLSRDADRCKISVGSNPWAPRPRTHDISSICQRYGGGGHPVVGAVSVGPTDVARARDIGAEIRATLAKG